MPRFYFLYTYKFNNVDVYNEFVRGVGVSA